MSLVNTDAPPELLVVQDFSLRFRGAPSDQINHVSFSVSAGKTLCIVGESGCGKSVTSLAMMGLLPVGAAQINSGQMLFEGQTLNLADPKAMRKIRGSRMTMIFQEPMSSLNPALDIGQIEGGYVQGAGWLTLEELVWDKAGRLSTHAPSTYKIPACSDRPAVFNVALWEAQNPRPTIYRSKAVGEPPFMLGISALMALSAAVAAFGSGYPALDAPATPERLLSAIARQKARRDA